MRNEHPLEWVLNGVNVDPMRDEMPNVRLVFLANTLNNTEMKVETAREIARREIIPALENGDEPLFLGVPEEKEYGWLFYWDSKRFDETQDPQWLVFGNGPILILHTGEVVRFGPHNPWRDLERFEIERGFRPAPSR